MTTRCAWGALNVALFFFNFSAGAWAHPAPPKTPTAAKLTLQDALATAIQNQPQLRQARADLAGSRAQADQTKAALWPQVSMGTSYQLGPTRQNINQVGVPITNVGNYALSVNADQLLYDFGQTHHRFQAGQAQVAAQQNNTTFITQQIHLNVRLAYFVLQAKQALFRVAEEALANQLRHQGRIAHLVEVGLRAPIDRAQATKDVANAQLQRINAQNEVRTAQAQLNQAMGVENPREFVLVDDAMPPVSGEDADVETLLAESLSSRADIAALKLRIEAQRLLVQAAEFNNFPSLRGSAGAGANGTPISDPFYNWGVGVGLTWPLYTGGGREAQAAQSRATLQGLQATFDLNRQQIRLAVEQNRLRLATAKAALTAAETSEQAAQIQLNLAEGRYEAGVGSILELGDAQLSLTQAKAQVVQERFNLASTRAQMLQALGRD
ncbi:MAG: TolC family protein [Candidatus Sericytochromatia bacterium]|nr:TolC family protein [Candidatus Sericytochromatia bacterium]